MIPQGRRTAAEVYGQTGWARNLLLLYADRLRQPQQVARHLRALTDQTMTGNGLIFHPATRGTGTIFGRVYELDGNTGAATGIAEALLQSHDGLLRLADGRTYPHHPGTVLMISGPTDRNALA